MEQTGGRGEAPQKESHISIISRNMKNLEARLRKMEEFFDEMEGVPSSEGKVTETNPSALNFKFVWDSLPAFLEECVKRVVNLQERLRSTIY